MKLLNSTLSNMQKHKMSYYLSFKVNTAPLVAVCMHLYIYIYIYINVSSRYCLKLYLLTAVWYIHIMLNLYIIIYINSKCIFKPIYILYSNLFTGEHEFLGIVHLT